MKLITLASGSKGNSTLIISNKSKILIDLGLSFKETKQKLSLLNISPTEIDAIFVTHEHIDHIKGLGAFVKNSPSTYVYVHSPNRQNIESKCPNLFPRNIISFDNLVEIKDLKIKAFSVSHDSYDCVGYQVSEGNNKMAIATDLGYYTEEILYELKQCSLVILEANHDVETLIHNPHYPTKTKARILSGKGHLSNHQSAEIIHFLARNKVRQIILAHLSEENNTPSLAYKYITNYLKSKNIIEGKDIFIDVSTQDKMGNLFLIEN